MEQVDYLVEHEPLVALCHHLTLSTNEKALTKNLDGVALILEWAKHQMGKLSVWRKRIEKFGGKETTF